MAGESAGVSVFFKGRCVYATTCPARVSILPHDYSTNPWGVECALVTIGENPSRPSAFLYVCEWGELPLLKRESTWDSKRESLIKLSSEEDYKALWSLKKEESDGVR